MIAAEALLRRLRQHGIRYLLANAGTDFAPIIEVYEQHRDDWSDFPEPVVIPHESVAMGMAHGYYLATGCPLAVMVHVNVGLANTVMGFLNAQSDHVPIIGLAGRTPVTEYKRPGARMTPIQYSQEMFDQNGMIREAVRWDYEVRYGEQIVDAVDRAMVQALADPPAPVLLTLPREALAESTAGGASLDRRIPVRPSRPAAERQCIEALADRVSRAQAPLVIVQGGDVEGRLAAALDVFSRLVCCPVAEPFAIRNVMPSTHPWHAGYALPPEFETADLILVVESPVPWISRFRQPSAEAFIVHIGADPARSHLPMRSHRADWFLTGDPVTLFVDLNRELEQRVRAERAPPIRVAPVPVQPAAASGPLKPARVGAILRSLIPDDALVVSELGPPIASGQPVRPNTWMTPPFSGGLGFGIPAALGAKLADPERVVVAAVGDGSYVFANPVACHQVAEALSLGIIVIVLDNGCWNATRRAVLNMYPEGAAAQQDKPALTDLEPSPDYALVAQASRAATWTVTDEVAFHAALAGALDVTQRTGTHAFIRVMVEKTDGF